MLSGGHINRLIPIFVEIKIQEKVPHSRFLSEAMMNGFFDFLLTFVHAPMPKLLECNCMVNSFFTHVFIKMSSVEQSLRQTLRL